MMASRPQVQTIMTQVASAAVRMYGESVFRQQLEPLPFRQVARRDDLEVPAVKGSDLVQPGVCGGLCRWTARPPHAGPHGLGTTDGAGSFAAQTVMLAVAAFLAPTRHPSVRR